MKEGSSLTLDEIVSFLKGRVADYKLPEALVVMHDFPMTPTGKIRRPELVKRVKRNGYLTARSLLRLGRYRCSLTSETLRPRLQWLLGRTSYNPVAASDGRYTDLNQGGIA